MMMCECVQVDTGQERCRCCGQPNPVGFDVPDEIWVAVTGGDQGVLCIMCFAARADAKGVEWCRYINWWPVSAVVGRRQAEVAESWETKEEAIRALLNSLQDRECETAAAWGGKICFDGGRPSEALWCLPCRLRRVRAAFGKGGT